MWCLERIALTVAVCLCVVIFRWETFSSTIWPGSSGPASTLPTSASWQSTVPEAACRYCMILLFMALSVSHVTVEGFQPTLLHSVALNWDLWAFVWGSDLSTLTPVFFRPVVDLLLCFETLEHFDIQRISWWSRWPQGAHDHCHCKTSPSSKQDSHPSTTAGMQCLGFSKRGAEPVISALVSCVWRTLLQKPLWLVHMQLCNPNSCCHVLFNI